MAHCAPETVWSTGTLNIEYTRHGILRPHRKPIGITVSVIDNWGEGENDICGDSNLPTINHARTQQGEGVSQEETHRSSRGEGRIRGFYGRLLDAALLMEIWFFPHECGGN